MLLSYYACYNLVNLYFRRFYYMSRPTTKLDLIESANTQFDTLWKLIDSMSEAEQIAPFNFGDSFNKKEAHWARDKNLRDVFIHLYEWHQLLLDWIRANTKGDKKPFLPSPYNWKTYTQLNVCFWEKHQSTSYKKSQDILKESHASVMKLIETFSNEELFSKKFYTWTGDTTLGSYCVSATSSHYDWAIKKIKKYLKEIKS